jgi:hypothetical protein
MTYRLSDYLCNSSKPTLLMGEGFGRESFDPELTTEGLSRKVWVGVIKLMLIEDGI